MYKLQSGGGVLRLADGASIPPDPANMDYRRYLADKDAGATVAPADAPPPPPPAVDYGAEVQPEGAYRDALPAVVTGLRLYLVQPSPTPAQNAQALKALIRVVLQIVSRSS